jgi:hypothetical protein
VFLNAKVAEGENEAAAPSLFEQRPLVGCENTKYRRRCQSHDTDADSPDGPSEETEQANDVEGEIQPILRPLIRLVEELGQRRQEHDRHRGEKYPLGCLRHGAKNSTARLLHRLSKSQ